MDLADASRELATDCFCCCLNSMYWGKLPACVRWYSRARNARSCSAFNREPREVITEPEKDVVMPRFSFSRNGRITWSMIFGEVHVTLKVNVSYQKTWPEILSIVDFDASQGVFGLSFPVIWPDCLKGNSWPFFSQLFAGIKTVIFASVLQIENETLSS